MVTLSRPQLLPDNYPHTPASYPVTFFRLQVEAAKRYLFESELKEVLEGAGLSPKDIAGDVALNVGHVASFFQGLRTFTGDEKAVSCGRDAFKHLLPLLSRSTGPISLRSAATPEKQFQRIRDALAGYNQRVGANFTVQWNGGSEADLFENTGQHCYGFLSDSPICPTLTGFLEETITGLSSVKVALTEQQCMAHGASACQWHCQLV